MHAIEFEADIENGLIRVPAIYHNLYNAHARIIVLMPEAKPVAVTFNPRLYFGTVKQPKATIDAYLHEVREGWQ